ncbi:hypothetical protein HXX76_008689 [Chlamydomonas incerta]|uniref:Uncharacterized protein n=1 Tax=Chlamydomonas incerta TaxID=51695 RepID=A0A835SW95_CHLIN|nr:hypothetical protein HXX76_008689 [Chlamydomonas incerta]|eukprot:KAG2432961.1 hypothetical protein HXX76_008689 [Chlamydomonas incerta]
MGLPPTFERSDQQSDGRTAQPMGQASCHAVVVEDVSAGGGTDAATGPRVLLLAHAYWQKRCPGKLVLAVARLQEPEWHWHGGGGSGGAAGEYSAAPGVEVQWHWHVLLASPDYDYLGPAVRRRTGAAAGAPALPSPSAVSQPVFDSIALSWHPRGNALAMCVGDTRGNSCVAVLSAGPMDVLWHRRWEQDVGPTIPAVPSPTGRGRGSSGTDGGAVGSGSRVASMAWVPATSLLAVLDDGGNLALLDAAGGCRGAALLCGAIKYGESMMVRLGPILGKAAPLAGSFKAAVSDFPRLKRNGPHAPSSGSGAGAQSSPGGQGCGSNSGTAAPTRYSLAFAQQHADQAGGGAEGGAGSGYGGIMLAVCNGGAVALARLDLEPFTPRGAGAGGGDGRALAVGPDAFGAMAKSPLTGRITSDTASGTPGDTPDRDAVAALPGGGGGGPGGVALRLDMLENSSFGSSAVSTPYMLGLQRVSGSFAGLGPAGAGVGGAGAAAGGGGGGPGSVAGAHTPLLTCRSNLSDAYPLPAWPVAWRTVFTLPLPGAPPAATAFAIAPSHFAYHGAGHHHGQGHGHGHGNPHVHHHGLNHYSSMPSLGGPGVGVGGGGVGGGAPSSVGASSAVGRQETSLAAASGAYPSPVASAANMRYPSMVALPDLPVASATGPAGGGGGGARGLLSSTDGGPPGSVAGDASVPRGAGPGAAAAGGGGGGGAAGGAGLGGGQAGATSSSGAGAPPLVCTAPVALRALQQGDVLVLRGCIGEALGHYPKAHIYGFLPAFLALVHLHRIDAAARLLRAYAHFTGQVAVAAAAASGAGGGGGKPAAGPGGGAPAAAATAAALRQRWQATMSAVLEGALTDAPMPTISGAAGMDAMMGGGGGGAVPNLHVNVPRRSFDVGGVSRGLAAGFAGAAAAAAASASTPSADATSPSQIKLRLPLEKFRDHAAAAAAAAAAAGAAGAAGGAAATAADGAAGAAGLQDGRGSGGHMSTSMLSVPEEAVLEVEGGVASVGPGPAVAAKLAALDAGGLPTPAPLSAPPPGPVVIENVMSPTLPETPPPADAGPGASAAAGAAGGGGGLGASAAADEDDLASPYCAGLGLGGPGSPGHGPAAALNSMLRVCLQLLLLACQAMAFVAFSAHGASRAAAAAAAVDILALPTTPGSPRSPGGGVLSRQAMRRLSSTMRMRSLKTRSVSMFGQQGGAFSAYGASGFGGSPPGAAAGGGANSSIPGQAAGVAAGGTGSGFGGFAVAGGGAGAGSGAGAASGAAALGGPALLRIGSTNSYRAGSVTGPQNVSLPPAAAGRQGGSITAGSAVHGTPPAGQTPTAAMTPPSAAAAAAAAYGQAAVAAASRPPPVTPVVIGFPIPVVWQPMPAAASSGASAGAAPHRSHSGVASGAPSGRYPAASIASSLPPHMLSTGAAVGGASSAADGSSAGPASAAGSNMSSPAAPRPTPMRLQLHHCAFDATRLWQDANTQHVSLGQSAAAVYLKPSYAAGLLLMAHTCSAQLQDLQQRAAAAAAAAAAEATAAAQGPGSQQQQPGPGGGVVAAAAVLSRFTSTAASVATSGPSEAPSPAQHGKPQPEGKDTSAALPNGYSASNLPAAAGERKSQSQSQLQLQQPRRNNDMLRAPSGAARVNWPLLRSAAAATQAAAVWQLLNDWHRAALLAFACANALTQLGGGSADLAAGAPRKRRKSILADLPLAAEDVLSEARNPGDPVNDFGAGVGGVGGAASGVLAAARAACLRMGQRVLLSQVGACQKVEVQDACGVLLELVALPRRLLGIASSVHVSLLQKVCTRVVDLLPKRVCITPLLPAGSVPPLLEVSHAGVRAQLVAHCGAAVARVLEELRLAAACGGTFVSLRETVQQISEHSTVDSTVRMLLRWQGAYEGTRVDAAAARLPECVQDMMLLPDTSDWAPESVLPPLQDAFVASGLLTATDAAGVVRAALAASAAAESGAPLSVAAALGAHMSSLAEEGGGAGGQAPGGSGQQQQQQQVEDDLQDLDELALMLDLAQLQHTLLAALQPFLREAIGPLRRQPLPVLPIPAAGGGGFSFAPGGAASGNLPLSLLPSLGAMSGGTSPSGAPPSLSNYPTGVSTIMSGSMAPMMPAFDGGGGSPEDEQEDALVDSMLEDPGVISGLPPAELAAACLKLLLKLQWALHCRAQVCDHMLRLARLQAPPPPPPPPPPPAAAASPPALRASMPTLPSPGGAPSSSTGVVAVSGGQLTHSPTGSRRPPSASSTQLPLPTSPRSLSLSHTAGGHRSFREYITHMASSSNAAAAAVAAAVAAAAASPGASGGGGNGTVNGAKGINDRRSDSALPVVSQAQAAASSPRPQLQQPAARPSPFQQLQNNSLQRPSQGGAATAAGGAGAGGVAAALVAAPQSPEGEAAQCALMAWTVALVRADVFHSGSELQACVLTVLTMVRSCPADLAAALDRALRRRSLFNARLAEHVNRLKRSAPQQPLPPPPVAGGAAAAAAPHLHGVVGPEAPAPTPSTTGGFAASGLATGGVYSPTTTAPSSPAPMLLPPPMLAARQGSAVMPGGSMAPASSLAAASDGGMDAAVRAATAAGAGGPPSGAAARIASLQFPAGRAGSFAHPGPSPLGRMVSTPRGTAADAAAGAGAGAEAGSGAAAGAGAGAEDGADGGNSSALGMTAQPSLSAESLPRVQSLQNAGSFALTGFGSGASVSMWAAPPTAGVHPPATIIEEVPSTAAEAQLGEGEATASDPAAARALAAQEAQLQPHPPAGATAQPHSQSAFYHHYPHAHPHPAGGAPRPSYLISPSTPSTPYTPAPPSLASEAQRHPVQLAVIVAHAEIRALSLKYLEYYADPSGAMPSGLSSNDGGAGAAVAAAAAGAGVGRAAAEVEVAATERSSAGSVASSTAGPPTGKPPRAQHGPAQARAGGAVAVSAFASSSSPAGAPPVSAPAAAAAAARRHVPGAGMGGASRAAAVSRQTEHSTLLQCLVCELVRSSHSVAATVSWRATLEGGRGLAGCFVHPILHGGSSAAGASVAAAFALGPGGGGSGGGGVAALGGGGAGVIVLGRSTAGSGSGEDAADGRGGINSMSGAEAAQTLLLSLMDVTQWATAPSHALDFGMGTGFSPGGGAYGRRTAPSMAPAAPGGAAAAATGPGAGAGGGGGVGALLGRKAPTDSGMVVVRASMEPPRSARAASDTPAGVAAVSDAPEPRVDVRRASSAERPLPAPRPASGTGSGAGSGTGARSVQLTDGGASASAGAASASVSMSGDRLARPSATPPGSPGVGGTGRLSFSALTDAPDLDPDTDVSGYPLAASSSAALGLVAVGSGRAVDPDAKAAADRHGNSSMKQHNNPAFGLHSPTPSNLSEFWEENSEAPSPASVRHTTGGGGGGTGTGTSPGVEGGGLSGGGGGGGPRMLLWRGNSGLGLSDAREGTRTHSPEPEGGSAGTFASGSGPHLAAAVASRNTSAGGATGEHSPAGRLSMEAGDGNGAAVAPGRSVEGAPPAAAATHPPVSGDGAAAGAGGTGEQEPQLPTLSYLALPGSLADIRKAVEEAKQGVAGGGAAEAGAEQAGKPVALSDMMAAAAVVNARSGGGGGGRSGGMNAGSPPLPFGEAGGSPGLGGGPNSAASLAMSDLSMLGVVRGGTASGATLVPRHGDDVHGSEGLAGAGSVGVGAGGTVVGGSARNPRGSDGGNSLSGLGGTGSMDGTRASASAFLCSVLTSPDVEMGRGGGGGGSGGGAAGPSLLLRRESGVSGTSEVSLMPARAGSSVSSGLGTPMLPNGDAAAAAGRAGVTGAVGPLPPRPRGALAQSQSLPRSGSAPRDHARLEQRQSLPRHGAVAAVVAEEPPAASPQAAPAASLHAATPTATPGQPHGHGDGDGTAQHPHAHPHQHHGGPGLHHAVLSLAHAQAREAATPSPGTAAGLSTGAAAGIGLSDFLRVPSTGSPADSFTTTPGTGGGGGGLASEFLATPRSGATTARSGAGSGVALAGPTRALLDELTTAAAAGTSQLTSPVQGSASASATLGAHGSPMPMRFPAAAGAGGARVPPISPAKDAWAPTLTPEAPLAEGEGAATAVGLGVAPEAAADEADASEARWAEAVGLAPQPQHPSSGALPDGGGEEAAPASTPSPRRVVSATSLRVSPVPPAATPSRAPATVGMGHTPPSASRIPHVPSPGNLTAVGSPPLPPSGRRRISGPGGSPGASAYQSPSTGGLIRASRTGTPPYPTHPHASPAGAGAGAGMAVAAAAGALGALSHARRSHEGEKGKGSLQGSRDLSGGGHNPLFNPPAAPGSPGPGGAGRGAAAATKASSFTRGSATGSNKPMWH